MKKILLLVGFTVLIASESFSQYYDFIPWIIINRVQDDMRLPNRLGLKMGAAASGQQAGLGNQSNYLGFDLAVQAEWYNKGFSTIVELGFVRKGFEQDLKVPLENDPLLDVLKNQETRIDYLYVDWLFKLKRNFNSLEPYVFFGPVMYVMTAHETDLKNSGYDYEFSDGLFGVNYGLGLDYNFKQYKLGLLVTHYYDITKAFEFGKEGGDLSRSAVNNAFGLSLVLSYELSPIKRAFRQGPLIFDVDGLNNDL